jgi:hypothetical protein
MANEELAQKAPTEMKRVFGVTLRAGDGRERRELVWLPTEDVRREFYRRARKNGLEVIINENEKSKRLWDLKETAS